MERLVSKIICMFRGHDYRIYSGTDLVRQKDGTWVTRHKWRCSRCGKVKKWHRKN